MTDALVKSRFTILEPMKLVVQVVHNIRSICPFSLKHMMQERTMNFIPQFFFFIKDVFPYIDFVPKDMIVDFHL